MKKPIKIFWNVCDYCENDANSQNIEHLEELQAKRALAFTVDKTIWTGNIAWSQSTWWAICAAFEFKLWNKREPQWATSWSHSDICCMYVCVCNVYIAAWYEMVYEFWCLGGDGGGCGGCGLWAADIYSYICECSPSSTMLYNCKQSVIDNKQVYARMVESFAYFFFGFVIVVCCCVRFSHSMYILYLALFCKL